LIAINVHLERSDSLSEGAELIKDDGYEFNELQRDGYNIQLISAVLSHYSETLINDFLEIVVFDILIGNTDRHSQNWGITKLANGENKLAPAYDNSSSLGREFNSNLPKVIARLKDNNLFKQYCHSSKGTYNIGWKEKYKIPLLDYIKLVYSEYPSIISHHINKLESLTPNAVEQIVLKVPQIIMNDSIKEFVIMFINYRRDYLLNLIK